MAPIGAIRNTPETKSTSTPNNSVVQISKPKASPRLPAARSLRLVFPITGAKGRSLVRALRRRDKPVTSRLSVRMLQMTPSIRMDSATRTKPAILAPRT